MKNKKYDLRFKEGKTSFFVEVSFPRTVSRRKRKKYTLKINHALKNLNDLCTKTLEFSLSSEYRLKVSFKRMKSYSGIYITETKEIILKDMYLRNISGFESTFFHETIHAIFDSFFGESGYVSYLTEGAAYYFENVYYPRPTKISAMLLVDRLSSIDFSHSYYFMKRLISDYLVETRSFFKNMPNARIELEAIMELLADDELANVKNFLNSNADFILTDSSTENSYGFVCIFRYDQLLYPVLYRIEKEEIEEYKAKNHLIIEEDLNDNPLKDFQGGSIPPNMFSQFFKYYSRLFIKRGSEKLLFPENVKDQAQFLESFLPQKIGESFTFDFIIEEIRRTKPIKHVCHRCSEIFTFIAE